LLIPWLHGFLGFRKALLTWTLVSLNVLSFMAFTKVERNSSGVKGTSVESLFVTGELYRQYLGSKSSSRSPASVEKLDSVELGLKALTDSDFIKTGSQLQYSGDPLLIESWKKSWRERSVDREADANYFLGLNSENFFSMSWITYQFSHANWMHLLSNVLVLFVFAGALERFVTGGWLISVYLLGGLGGAILFSMWTDSFGGSSLVGASASISALMAFYLVLEPRKRLPFFYFLSPVPGFYGTINLHKFWFWIVLFLKDISAWLSPSILGQGSVAHLAHLGGLVAGVALALVYQSLHPDRDQRIIPWEQSPFELNSP
jgi:membrane associated rhomboid family serine protease